LDLIKIRKCLETANFHVTAMAGNMGAERGSRPQGRSGMSLSRRNFLLATSALSLGCTQHALNPGLPNNAELKVRGPAIGQSWRYRKTDLVTGAVVDTEFEQVTAVKDGGETRIRCDALPIEARIRRPAYPAWGTDWLRKYLGQPLPGESLEDEVQAPWGMILVDSHWQDRQVYQEPIPLWPTQLRPGWSKTIGTYYETAESPHESLPWQLTMHAQQWELITVPAGQFTALLYNNVINFRYSNASEKVEAQRLEKLWLVPEIGRWAARESLGTFYQDVGQRFHENTYRWELLNWA
jgi:hypothetical protein